MTFKRISLDYETRSIVELKKAGAYAYARDKSTKVLCAAYNIDGEGGEMWQAWRGEKMPVRLRLALNDPKCEIHAWNSQFERLITRDVLGIDVPIERYHCTAAWARARGLPGKLEGALKFTGNEAAVIKKRQGNKVMLKWCRPLPNGGWADDPHEYNQLIIYCDEDVKAERELQRFMQRWPMTVNERRDFLLTERVNDLGLPVDTTLAKAAMKYGLKEANELAGEILFYSSGEVRSAGSHAAVKSFLKARLTPGMFEHFFTRYVDGIRKETSDGASREAFLASEAAREIEPDVSDLLQSLDDANKSSVAKFGRIVARAGNTGRVQGAYLYAGAAQTKRFSSTGVQMHNLPRATPKDLDAVVAQVMAHKLPDGERVMHVLSACLRPTIMAPKGRVLVWGDWSAVEARAMPWLAGHKPKLDLYRDGIDVYNVNATDIYGTPYDEVPDDQRQVGKVAELSLQFGGWKGALRAMARNYRINMTEREAERIAGRWRGANAWAARYQWALYGAFLMAANGTPAAVRGVTYRPVSEMKFNKCATVECTLPDGTVLLYPGGAGEYGVEVTERVGKDVFPVVFDDAFLPEYTADRLRYTVAKVQYFKAAFNTLLPEDIWHGLLAENVTQGICASLLRDCLARVEARLDPKHAVIVGHTHDEILTEADAKWEKIVRGILHEEMVRVPKWMTGMPLAATIKSGVRYIK